MQLFNNITNTKSFNMFQTSAHNLYLMLFGAILSLIFLCNHAHVMQQMTQTQKFYSDQLWGLGL